MTNLPNTMLADDSTVSLYTYGNGVQGAEVLFYRIDGGGHGWPSPTQFGFIKQQIFGKKNQDIVACDEAWAFFQRHALDQVERATKVIIVQELIEKLRDEENKHIHMIKKKITDMKRGL